MMILQFRSKRDKERLLEKARKMEEYSAMIVECLEEAEDDDYEKSYRGREYRTNRYEYRGGM